jgi:glycosyltransferase involved in cell wall biosynthesis
MRIALVTHGFPPVDRTGVEIYTEALARELARLGHHVEVFAPSRDAALPDGSTRREARAGYGTTWVNLLHPPPGPRQQLFVPLVRRAFVEFLERERPQVVHFQHLIKLGLGLVDEVAARGLPSLYTAHDYWPVCHRYTLLRPDLTHCDVRGDSSACARCDLALGHLNGLPELGDYQMGALEHQLDAPARAALAALLAGEEGQAGLDPAAAQAAVRLRSELDAQRARATAKIDAWIAPSRFLADELVRGGIQRERIVVQPYGIEAEPLRSLPPPRLDGASPLRFAYLGGLSKHKGVHVLLDAWERAHVGGELSIWGYATDAPYVAWLEQRAREVGATWRGPYDHADLPGCLAETDVVVVPSIWAENYPIVIREAFAAGRPVIATRFGALGESVRDGVDGLTFPLADAGALAEILRRCVHEPGLLERLRCGISPPKTVTEEARELATRYAALVEGARQSQQAGGALPPSLVPFAQRFAALETLNARELFARVLGGLEELRRGLGGAVADQTTEELLTRALGDASRAHDELADARVAEAWIQETVESQREEQRHRERELAWLRETRAALEKEREWLSERLRADERGRAEMETAVRGIERALAEAVAERARMQEDLARQASTLEQAAARRRTLERDLQQQAHSLEEAAATRRQLEQDLSARAKSLANASERLTQVEEHLDETEERLTSTARRLRVSEENLRGARAGLDSTRIKLGATETHLRTAAELGLAAIRAQEQLLAIESGPLFDHLAYLLGQEHRLQAAPGEDTPTFSALIEAVRAARMRLARLGPELEWRRDEMHSALVASQRRLARVLLARTGVGQRIRGWQGGATETTR